MEFLDKLAIPIYLFNRKDEILRRRLETSFAQNDKGRDLLRAFVKPIDNLRFTLFSVPSVVNSAFHLCPFVVNLSPFVSILHFTLYIFHYFLISSAVQSLRFTLYALLSFPCLQWLISVFIRVYLWLNFPYLQCSRWSN